MPVLKLEKAANPPSLLTLQGRRHLSLRKATLATIACPPSGEEASERILLADILPTRVIMGKERVGDRVQSWRD